MERQALTSSYNINIIIRNINMGVTSSYIEATTFINIYLSLPLKRHEKLGLFVLIQGQSLQSILE